MDAYIVFYGSTAVLNRNNIFAFEECVFGRVIKNKLHVFVSIIMNKLNVFLGTIMNKP